MFGSPATFDEIFGFQKATPSRESARHARPAPQQPALSHAHE